LIYKLDRLCIRGFGECVNAPVRAVFRAGNKGGGGSRAFLVPVNSSLTESVNIEADIWERSCSEQPRDKFNRCGCESLIQSITLFALRTMLADFVECVQRAAAKTLRRAEGTLLSVKGRRLRESRDSYATSPYLIIALRCPATCEQDAE